MTYVRPRYLLIDDDANFGAILRRQAKHFGADVLHVASIKGLSELKMLSGFDAVFVDYDLEDMTGFEVAEFLQAFLPDVPVIMVSSTNRPLQDSVGHLPNVIGFVSKWTNPHDFMIQTVGVLRDRPGIRAAA